MLGLVITLLVIWVILSILGFAVKGLFWLAMVGLVLIIATVIFGFLRKVFTRKP